MATLTPLQALRAARLLIEDPGHWCQGSSARDLAGTNVTVHHPAACRFCAAGALWKVTNSYLGTDDDTAVQTASGRLCDAAGMEIVEFNDCEDTDHAAVLSVYDRAIYTEEWDEEVHA